MIPFFLFLFGAILGSFINWYIDRIGLEPRFRSPWRKSGLVKRWFDYLPIFGWLSMRRFGGGTQHGLESRLFWLRPLWVELLTALGIVWLFYWEAGDTSRFAVHAVLFAFLLAASLIDFDDMIITESITVTGTATALLFAMFLPQTPLPVTEIHWDSGYYFVSSYQVPLNLFSPNIPVEVPYQLLWESVLWFFFCFAMLDRFWYQQLPLRLALISFCRHIYRSWRTKWILASAVLVPMIFSFQSNLALFSALFGMASGMILIWGIRLVAGRALGMEAMGFGDVTIMGMIGAFLGWQCTLLVLLFSLLPGLFFGLWNLISGKGQALPFGPFLCLGAGIVVLFWQPIWKQTAETFELGWILGIMLLVCLVLLGMMLRVWCIIKKQWQRNS
jgi:prepilin signal peptidase PulO-like enzyme (type II secretory pathway)